MQCRLRDRRSRLFSLGLRPCPLRTEIPPDSLNLLIMLCTVEGEISKSLPIFLWGTLFLNISIIFSRICWQTGDPRPIFAPKGLDLSWMLLLYQIIITITCWHQLFQNTSLFNQFTSLLALNCSCPNFFWNVLQVWMTGKDVQCPPLILAPLVNMSKGGCENKSALLILFYLSFKKFTKFQPSIEEKQLKVGGKSHCEINAFSSSCWTQLLAPNYCKRPFPR